MITGMTGFGGAEFSLESVKGTIEIKSVNHRYLDIAYYLPIGFAAVESKIRGILEKHLERGRVTISLKILTRPAHDVSFNTTVIKAYLKEENQLKKQFKLKGELSLVELMQLPGVVDTKEIFVEPEMMWPTIEKSVHAALRGLVHMRKREGKSLTADIKGQLKLMSSQSKAVRARAKEILRAKQKTLTGEEFSSLQKSNDINEELARLEHHVEEMNLLLKTDGVAGKKIDFIAQEMQRETNTIGSKVQDTLISNAVIALKSKIEKIREQSQNIE